MPRVSPNTVAKWPEDKRQEPVLLAYAEYEGVRYQEIPFFFYGALYDIIAMIGGGELSETSSPPLRIWQEVSTFERYCLEPLLEELADLLRKDPDKAARIAEAWRP